MLEKEGAGRLPDFFEKSYELSNHLGNVLVTVSDRKMAMDDGTYEIQCAPGGGCELVWVSSALDGVIDYYTADVITATDYYPFGLDMPGRKFGAAGRYGFNGKERDKDMNSLTAYDYGFRIYNPAIGKFLSVDPLTNSYPWYSPYHFAGNNPIHNIDLDGLEECGYGQRLENQWIPALGSGKMTEAQFERNKMAFSIGGTFGLGVAVTVYTGGRAAPLVKKLFVGALLWASRPENQQRVSDVVNFTAELFNPDPTPLNPGNPSSQLGSDIKQVAKKLFTAIKPIFQRRKELAKAWGIAEKFVEYSKQVFTKDIDEGTELIQYRVKGSEGTIGNYYALPGTKPEAIGIKADEVVETLQVKVKTTTKALVSSHKKDLPYYKDGSTVLEGGGTQIFSPELKNNVEVINKTKPDGSN